MSYQEISFPIHYRDRAGCARWSVGTAEIAAPAAAPLAITVAIGPRAFNGSPSNDGPPHEYRIHDRKLFGEAHFGTGAKGRSRTVKIDRAWPDEVRDDPMRWLDILRDGDRWRQALHAGTGIRWRNGRSVEGPSIHDTISHPLLASTGRGPAGADEVVEDARDEPDYVDKLERARHIAGNAMIFKDRIWLAGQGPVVTNLLGSNQMPNLASLAIKPYLDNTLTGLAMQSVAFPIGQLALAEETYARFHGRKVSRSWWRDYEIHEEGGYDIGNMPAIAEANVIQMLWQCRKLEARNIGPATLETIMNARKVMRLRWPGVEFDLQASATASWLDPRVGKVIPDISDLGAVISDMATNLDGLFDEHMPRVLGMSAWRVEQHVLKKDLDDEAIADVPFGI